LGTVKNLSEQTKSRHQIKTINQAKRGKRGKQERTSKSTGTKDKQQNQDKIRTGQSSERYKSTTSKADGTKSTSMDPI
jgi:hypothetical protein